MAIKIKYRDPKITDFDRDEFIINVQTGDIFYKVKQELYKLRGDNLTTSTDKITFNSNIEAIRATFRGYSIGDMVIGSEETDVFQIGSPAIVVSGSIIPAASDAPIYDLGSSNYPFKKLWVSDGSIHYLKTGMGVGYSKISTSFRIGRYGRATSTTEETTFTKQDIDDLKEGKSLNKEGKISASGDMNIDGNYKVRGSSSFSSNITSSGHISASGLLYGTGLQGTSLDFTINSGNTFDFLKAPLTPAATIDAEGNVTASGAITASQFEGNNIGPIYENYIYLTPADFYAQGNTDTRNPFSMGGNGAYLTDGARFDYHAMAVIPNGYKATHAVVYDNNPAASTYTTYSSSIGASGGALTAGQAGGSTATNTEADITDITGGSGVYCVLIWNPALALNRCYGGRITLAKT